MSYALVFQPDAAGKRTVKHVGRIVSAESDTVTINVFDAVSWFSCVVIELDEVLTVPRVDCEVFSSLKEVSQAFREWYRQHRRHPLVHEARQAIIADLKASKQ